MKNTKKGFTLVELLVVIAILAILATVAVVGYTSFIDKANLSVDQQAVEQLNTALTAGTVTFKEEDFTIENIGKVLVDSGFNMKNGINALRSGYDIYWYKTYNTILLADDNGEVIYPTDNAELVEKFKTEYDDGTKAYNLGALVDGSSVVMNGKIYESFQEALNEGGEITLFDDMVVTSTYSISKDTVINLNGYKLDMSSVVNARAFEVTSDADLIINAEGAEIALGGYGIVRANNTGNTSIAPTITINGGTYTGDIKNGAFVRVTGNVNADVTLNNVTVNLEHDGVSDPNWIMNTNGIKDGNEVKLTVNGGSFSAMAGFQVQEATFNNVTINTDGLCVQVMEGKEATFTNCNFTSGSTTISAAPAAAIAVSYNSVAKVVNSTITGEKYALYVYNTGGHIEVTGGTITGAPKVDKEGCTIKVDGEVVATK